MIVDVNAYAGHWPSFPVPGELEAVRSSLRALGVDAICLSPLEAAWCRNPHLCNAAIFEAARQYEDLWPVPVLDPTIATWERELQAFLGVPRARLVKLLPAYSPYELSAASPLLQALEEAGLGAIVQTRLDDPRRHHPRAQVPDVAAAAIAEVAAAHPGLTVILGGPRTGEIRALRACLLELPNLYADVSQADGFEALKVLASEGLVPKLLFGSHAPLFHPWSALARVVQDLPEEEAIAVLGGNASRVLGLDGD